MLKVYVETTIPSYLTARPGNNLIFAAQQEETRHWWSERLKHELFVSEAVLKECAGGDPSAAILRLAALEDIPVLDVDETVGELAERLVEALKLPKKAETDALHIATSASHGMDVMLTWNCKQIANPFLLTKIVDVCSRMGYRLPILATPGQMLLGET